MAAMLSVPGPVFFPLRQFHAARYPPTKCRYVMQLILVWCTLFCSATGLQAVEIRSVLQGDMIRIEPSGAAFRIPADWISWYSEYHDNLYLTRTELNQVKEAAGSADAAYAQVVDAVIPFANCAVHAGNNGWGRASVGLGLQMRAYVGAWLPKDFGRRLAINGLSVAKKMAGQETKRLGDEDIVSKLDRSGGWHRTLIRFPVRYRDDVDEVRWTANVEFYIRSFGPKTFVLVFMYPDSTVSQMGNVKAIVSSFTSPAQPKEARGAARQRLF